MPIQFNLPDKTAAESAEFSKRFNELPTELQNMIIAETVRFPEPVPLQHHRQVLRYEASRFAEDETMLEEAVKQFFKTNQSLYWIHKPLDQLHRTASLVRHLNLNLTIMVHGGDVQEESTYMLPPDLVDYIEAIPRVFRFLERLQLTVDNAGWTTPGAEYTLQAYPGTSELPDDLPGVLSHDRMSKMAHVLELLRELEFPRWRRDLIVKKKVLFKQALLGESGVTVTMPDPYPMISTPDYGDYAAALHGFMDLPQAIVYIDDRI